MKRICIYLALGCAALGASAQTSAYDEVVNRILETNPSLRAARLSAEAERFEQMSENVVEAPSVDFTHVWGAGGIGNKLQLDVAQEFEWPGVYGARSRAAKAGEAAALMAGDASALEMAQNVRGLLDELVYVRRQLGVLDVLLKSFGELSEAIDKGVKGGELTAIDQRKMQIETYEIESQIAEVKTREQQIVDALQALSATPLDLTRINAYAEIQPCSLEDYLAAASEDPDVVSRMLTAQSEEARMKAARMSQLPGFSVGYEFQQEMGDRFNGLTLGIKLPVFGGAKARKAAQTRKLAAEQEAESILSTRRAEIKGAYTRLQSDRDRLEAYQKTFGDNKYPQLLLKAYEGGQLSVIEYLTEIHYYHQTMLTYLETEYNYHTALTILTRLTRR